jgi:hypothetical protein
MAALVAGMQYILWLLGSRATRSRTFHAKGSC